MIYKLESGVKAFSIGTASLVCGVISFFLGICNAPHWDGAEHSSIEAKTTGKKIKFELTRNRTWEDYDFQGQIFFNQGQYNRAESYFQRSLEIAKRDSIQRLISLQKLALLNHIMGTTDEERQYDLQIHSMENISNLAENKSSQESLSRARQLMLRAENSSPSGRQPPISVIYPKKAPLIREALLIRQQVLPPQSQEIIESLGELIWMDGAWSYQAIESPVANEHEALLRQLVALVERDRADKGSRYSGNYGKSLEDLGTLYRELAYVLYRKHDDNSAEKYWNRAFLIFENAQRNGVIPYPGVTLPELIKMSDHLTSQTKSAQILQIVCPGYTR